jgi:hypothetical protein
VRSLLGFPDPVDEVSARLVAGGVVLMAVGVLLGQEWLLLVLAYGFLARVLTGPRLSPLGLLVTRVVRPRLRVSPRPVPGPPKRFAQGIGAVVTVVAALSWFGFGWHGFALVLAGLMVLFALLESALGFCVGCRLFALLIKLGVVPEQACLDCADIELRWARLSPSGR